MIQAESKHIKIIKDVLSKYPYTFYAFGSRARDKPKRLSDLDLCFFEDIPWNVRSHIEEDFEESNLPYKVDLIDWQRCDSTFRKLIADDLICLQASPDFLKVEHLIFGYFNYVPTTLGFEVTNELGAIITSSGIVCGALLTDINIEAGIDKIIKRLHGKSFSWWIGPSSKPDNLGKILQGLGFARTWQYAMISNLKDLLVEDSSNKLNIKPARDLEDFLKIRECYDSEARSFFARLPDPSLSIKEKFFVGYKETKPVTIAVLYIDGDIGGVFGVVTLETERKQGFGTEMMQHLIKHAKQKGVKYLCLSTSDDEALSIYKKNGFKVVGQFEYIEIEGNKT